MIRRLDRKMVTQGPNRLSKYYGCSSLRALLGEFLGGGRISESCLEKMALELGLKGE